ncbi:MAG: GxxExxY protein [Verrucomicrobiota bacterium]
MMGCNNRPELIYPELSYSIIGSAMEVHNGLGPGWDEWDYHRAMIEALSSSGHEVLSHNRKALGHRGEVVDHFELDLLVDDLIILELKHIKSAFHPEHYTQIINYLKRWEKRLGILINFGLERLANKRIPYDPVAAAVHFSGKWKELGQRNPISCKRVVTAIKGVLAEHGYGYGVQVFQNLLMEEFRSLDAVAIKPILTPKYGGLVLEGREIDCLLIDSELLVSISASARDASAADLAYLKSYMKQTGISYGVLIDIGSADIQLKGVL